MQADAQFEARMLGVIHLPLTFVIANIYPICPDLKA
ncbi:unannotated protein [freshwater metagenome]|uniref:Unannotated protein n=1 Tax=freshwater metagenome TaxID=449393 RepID=A0A6J6BR40_9ZZZZ